MTNPLFATLSGTTSIHGKTSIHPCVIKTMGINWGITTNVSHIYIYIHLPTGQVATPALHSLNLNIPDAWMLQCLGSLPETYLSTLWRKVCLLSLRLLLRTSDTVDNQVTLMPVVIQTLLVFLV